MTDTPKPADVKLGANVRERRRDLKMSQQKLAEALGLTFQQVQKYERGTNRISGSTMLEISKALNCRVEDIYGDLQEPMDRLMDEMAKSDTGMQVISGWSSLTPEIRTAIATLVASNTGKAA